jgi:hypothetical protein
MIRLADADEITRRVQELRYEALRRGQECHQAVGKTVSECWCMGVGKNKVALPCPVVGGALPAATVEIPL